MRIPGRRYLFYLCLLSVLLFVLHFLLLVLHITTRKSYNIGFKLDKMTSTMYIITKKPYNIDIKLDKMTSTIASTTFTNTFPWKGTNRSLTVVTAFFDIGDFPKVISSQMRYMDSYKKWREVYKHIQNPLVVYTDSAEFAQFFQVIRKSLNAITIIEVISREELWSFKLLPEIKAIYSKPGYPIHYPNTYVPTYTSVTHSKLTLVKRAIKANHFNSDYYCWVDMGYFREIVERKKDFFLEIPSDFNSSRIGVTRVFDSDLKQTSAKSIIHELRQWIAGGLFLGKSDVMTQFESQYKQRVEYYLAQGLMNNEEQILYAMFTEQERKTNPIDVELQLYIPGNKNVIIKNEWFYLGYVMYAELTVNTSGQITT